MKYRYWVPAISWMAAIFLFSTDWFSAAQTGSILEALISWLFPTFSHEEVKFIHFAFRKSAHLTAYALLSWFYLIGLSGSWRVREQWSLNKCGTSVLLSVLYAATDEWHQSFSNVRTASWADVGYDFLGALTLQIYFRLRYNR